MLSRSVIKFCPSALLTRRFSDQAKPSIGSRVVPQKPVVDDSKEQLVAEARTKVTVDRDTIEHLERLSLVDFANKAGVNRLIEAIQFVQPLRFVNTEGVEPLVTVLEERDLYLQEDEVTDGNIRDDILLNAHLKEEEYFVAPPGNIPLAPKGDYSNQSELPSEPLSESGPTRTELELEKGSEVRVEL